MWCEGSEDGGRGFARQSLRRRGAEEGVEGVEDEEGDEDVEGGQEGAAGERVLCQLEDGPRVEEG